MIYPKNFEQKIGFSTLRDLLDHACLSPLGKEKVHEMHFSSSMPEVSAWLHQTAEMLSLLQRGAQLPVDNLHDITPALRSIQADGSFMTPTDLYRLSTSLQTIARLRTFFTRTDEEENLITPHLSELFSEIATFPAIISVIDKILNRFGEIADNASPQLAEIRRSISSASASMSRVMSRVLERAVAQGIVEADASPSMRDGRLVIPVAAGLKRRLSGIVHDESASGKTAYIEPTEVVEASNRLRELHEAEKREIHRILVEVTAQIRPHIPEMLGSYSLLGTYDFIRAKAIIARDFDAQMPVLEPHPEIDWYGAIHPVLALSLRSQGRQVVPLNLRLDREHRILVISGPNAGGKSVTLKTAAIVQYSLQCGMLPTLHSNSHVGLFSNIFIDIGDEQSIENDLSTYSSHLRNMKYFLTHSGKDTFILIDEMGSGTEPQIGGALAQAILVQLNQAGVYGIITTHYQNLKTFADAEPGLINGAMLYDRGNMTPLFKLSIGNPGSSFALEIARKTGLPQSVIDNARELVGSDYVNMDKYLLDLARDRRYWSNKRQSIREKEAKLEALLEQYEQRLDNIKAQRREILDDARREASEILSTTNSKVERTIKEIRDAQAEKERTRELRRELDEYRKQVNTPSEEKKSLPGLPEPKRRKKPTEPKKQQKPDDPRRPFAVGDYVRMSQGGIVGTILSLTQKDAEVAFGALRSRVPLGKLQHANKPTNTAATQTASISRKTTDDSRRRQLNFKPELDLRGFRADEALQATAYFLDDAVQFAQSQVRILHGTGTGALRQAIRQYLQSVPDVESFHDEDVRFGGAGITVVHLR